MMMEDPEDKDLAEFSLSISRAMWMQWNGGAQKHSSKNKAKEDCALCISGGEEGLFKQVFVWNDWMQVVKILEVKD